MRTLLLLLGIIFVATATNSRAEAQYYPWCAIYSGLGSGASCGYTTFEQCVAEVRGLGGFCEQNPQPAPSSSAKYPPRHRYYAYPY